MQTIGSIPAISKLTDIYSGDYPSNKITNHREHTCYFQKVGTKREKKRKTTGTIRAINSYSYMLQNFPTLRIILK
ncbi:hypothetical protein Hanom_Chr02g00176791 [Helianthus anomalus]